MGREMWGRMLRGGIIIMIDTIKMIENVQIDLNKNKARKKHLCSAYSQRCKANWKLRDWALRIIP